MADSKKIDDGGPAAPCSNEQFTHGNPSVGDAWSGMSLRDWFAGQALAGFCANSSKEFENLDSDNLALFAWDQADAMIAARKGGS